jgi:hypothetical protein
MATAPSVFVARYLKQRRNDGRKPRRPRHRRPAGPKRNQSATIGPTGSRLYLARPWNVIPYRITNEAPCEMAIVKRILVADRVRRPPKDGFSWIDRRFLREFAVRLSGDAVFLYFFLTAVSDKHGLSYYSETTLALRLRTSEATILEAREELITYDLVAYQAPLTQVLSLPKSSLERRNRWS